MKISFVTICLLFIVLSFATVESFGCSLAFNTIKKFNATEYVFIGEVVGYTNVYEKQPENSTDNNKSGKDESVVNKVYKEWINRKMKAVGLILKIEDSVYLPKTPNKFFEVFPLYLQADCSYQGIDKLSLSKSFTVGSKVRVIGKESFYFPNLPNQENLRLESFNGNIVSNDSPTDEPITNTLLKLEYKKIKYGDESKQFLLQFELRKDLRRLEFSSDYKEIQETLERLIYYPSFHIDYEMIVKNYTTDFSSERAKLIQKRKEFLMNPK